MARQEKVIDLIDHARDFHSQLSKYYDELSAKSDRMRVKILLDYLSESAKRHEQALAEYEESASHDVTDTWFQFGPDKVSGDYLELAKITVDMDMDAVLREALRLDQCLSDLYQEVINGTPSERVKEVFTNLLETNRKEMRDLARDFAHMHDW